VYLAGLKLNWTHQLLAYADDPNLPEDDIDTLTKITETSIDASDEIGLQATAEKSKCMLQSRHQNAGKSGNKDNY
jgi:hypothetical protein